LFPWVIIVVLLVGSECSYQQLDKLENDAQESSREASECSAALASCEMGRSADLETCLDRLSADVDPEFP
jgi:hypothetical protein